ncbi:hypothetical protein AB0H87_39425, partial [Asanoa sp. NPDC050611]
AAARDDPGRRIALLARTYHGPFGRAPRHVPFRRAALSFMRWQADRGVLHPAAGSPWWRAVNEGLLRDGCEAMARSGGTPGDSTSSAVDLWLAFIERPTPPHCGASSRTPTHRRASCGPIWTGRTGSGARSTTA